MHLSAPLARSSRSFSLASSRASTSVRRSSRPAATIATMALRWSEERSSLERHRSRRRNPLAVTPEAGTRRRGIVRGSEGRRGQPEQCQPQKIRESFHFDGSLPARAHPALIPTGGRRSGAAFGLQKEPGAGSRAEKAHRAHRQQLPPSGPPGGTSESPAVPGVPGRERSGAGGGIIRLGGTVGDVVGRLALNASGPEGGAPTSAPWSASSSPASTPATARHLAELMTEDHRFMDATGGVFTGRRTMRQGWESFFGMFPDYRIEVDALVAEGETVALFGWASGTFSGREGASRRRFLSDPCRMEGDRAGRPRCGVDRLCRHRADAPGGRREPVPSESRLRAQSRAGRGLPGRPARPDAMSDGDVGAGSSDPSPDLDAGRTPGATGNGGSVGAPRSRPAGTALRTRCRPRRRDTDRAGRRPARVGRRLGHRRDRRLLSFARRADVHRGPAGDIREDLSSRARPAEPFQVFGVQDRQEDPSRACEGTRVRRRRRLPPTSSG